ncbi:MAG: tagaturonate epimerase family protein [Atribacterota bacterium]
MFPFSKNFLCKILKDQGLYLFPYFFGEKEVFFPLWSPGKWFIGLCTDGEPRWEGGKFLGAFSGKHLFAFPLTLENLEHLREAIPELTPQAPGEENASGILDVSPSFFPELFKVLWEKNFMPFAFAHGAETLEGGILFAFWGAFAGGKSGPFGAAFLGGEKDLLVKALRLGYTLVILEAKNCISSEVFLWDTKKLADAFFSLTSRQKELWKRYAERTIRFSKDCILSFSEEPFLRMLLAYSPLLDVLEECFVVLSGYRVPFAFGVSFGDLSKEAHFFLAEELHRRGVDFKILLFESQAEEHLLLSRTIQGYRPGFWTENPASLKEEYFVILKYPGFSIFCNLLATKDPKSLREKFGPLPLVPSSYKEHRETFEALLFHSFEDFVQELQARFS